MDSVYGYRVIYKGIPQCVCDHRYTLIPKIYFKSIARSSPLQPHQHLLLPIHHIFPGTFRVAKREFSWDFVREDFESRNIVITFRKTLFFN